MSPDRPTDPRTISDRVDAPAAIGRRQASAARTQQLLIDSGSALAERTGLMGLSVNLLVEHAGVSKGTFFHHFGSRSAYVVALHRAFHDGLQDEIARSIDGMPAGAERLDVVASTYLDVCLRQRGVRALLLEARADPQIQHEINSRNEAAAHVITSDFIEMHTALPAETARLWIGLVVEVALLELTAGGSLPASREALSNLARGRKDSRQP